MSDHGDDDEPTQQEQDDYKKWKSSLGGHKRYLSSVSNNVAPIVDKEQLEGEEVIEAEQLRDTLEERVRMIGVVFDELLGNPLTTLDDINSFEEFMRGVKGKLAKLKFKLQKEIKPKPGLDESALSASTKSICDTAVKYPELSLPSFSGGKNGCRDFRPFYQLFKELVEDKEEVPDICKVQYLRQCLPEGSEAWGVIHHIPPVAENYGLLVNLLKSRYGNIAGEANRLRRTLMQVSGWHVCNSVEAQRRLVDHVRQNLTLLEQVDEVGPEDMSYLVLNILGVLPERLKFKVQELPKHERTVEKIIKMVEDSIVSRLEVSSFSDSRPSERRSSHQPQRQSYSSSHLYHSSSQASCQSSSQFSSPPDNRSCIYCGDNGHSPHGCSKKSQEERSSIARGRCWNCLADDHQVRNCRVPSRCNCGKRGKHSPSLCGVAPPWKVSGRQSGGSTGRTVRGKAEVASMITVEALGARYLSSVVLEIHDRWNRPVKVRLLLDSCATHSYGLRSKIDQLPVMVRDGTVDMKISTFSGLKKLNTNMVELKLPGDISISIALTDDICEPLQGQELDQYTLKELEGYSLADPACVVPGSLPVDILIGVDHFWKLITDKIVRLSSGVVIMSTLYGWVLSGELTSRKSSSRKHSGAYLAHSLIVHGGWRESRQYGLSAQDSWYNPQAHVLCAQDCPVPDQDDKEFKCEIEKFWDLDTLGIKPEREISPVLEDFLHTVSQDPETGRYTVSLPQRRNIINLPSNFTNSKHRLGSLQAKFRRPGNEDFASKYRAVIQDHLQKGIIEKVDVSETEMKMLTENVGKSLSQFYIPHHGVHQKGKVRVVLDASAHAFKGALSLNDCLLKGPSLLNLLAEVLFSFRLHGVVLLADIVKAFLNISVAVEDRDFLRFLWVDDDGNLVVYRYTRVPFGTGPSPFLLNATVRYHLEKCVTDQSLLQLLLRSLYVDDVLSGGPSVEFVLQLKDLLEDIFGKAAMKLHGWDSNSVEVREALGVTDQADDTVVLGVLWNRVRDDMGINLEKVLKESKGGSTKRELLRTTARFYDPHGLFNPVVLIPKLLFCRVCRLKTRWDDPLPEEVAREWIEWRSQLPILEGVRWQRHALLPSHDRLELHGFSDASQLAYSAAVYIKSSHGGVSQCNLIMCKNRVAPQKKLSIPRLELMGALLLARLMAVVVAFLKHVRIDSIVYYTDSMNVLYWLRTEHRMWAVFVACRIKEINSLSNFVDWKWVKTDENPADLATRGLKPVELVDNQLWWHGPDFLCTGRCVPDVDSIHPPAVVLQERCKVVQVVVPVQSGVSSVIKSEEFSTLRNLLSRTVLYLRFVYWFAKKYSKDPSDRFDFNIPDLFAQARLLWIRSVQADYYSEEVRFCRSNPARIPTGMKVPSSLARQLALFMDPNGILRTGTRLQNAVIPESTKYPILLPKDSHVTQLLIVDTHRRLCHAGVRQVMSSIRGFYWIPQCRRTIAKLLRACVNCRKVSADFYPVPDPPPLPDFRVAKVDSFDHVGLDHCGPLYTRVGKAKPQKCYVLIITCAVTRGICLELVEDMSVNHFMLGFRRFVSDHGLPSYIMSDNSPTFTCCSKEFRAILNDPRFERYMGSRNIRWDHYLEYAPHWGGWIERLNHVFKASVRKVLSGVQVSYVELNTLLKEVAAVVNSRPISYVYDDVHEGQAITPSMLYCGKDLTQLPPDMFNFRFGRKHPMTCKERLKYLDKVQSYFWTRFSREYLTEQAERHAVTRHGKEVRQPKLDEVVLVKEGGSQSKQPRRKWRLGRIVKLHPGRDGGIRSVDVRISMFKGDEPCVERHLSPRQLVPLECDGMSE